MNLDSNIDNYKILSTGIVLYENVLDISNEDISDLINVKNFIDEQENSLFKNVKNVFFYGFKHFNKEKTAIKIQNSILRCLAHYSDLYDEAIHTLQWQENIYIDIDKSGEAEVIFNCNKSIINSNGEINTIPFSRQILIEIMVNDDYLGGGYEWPYFNNLTLDNIKKGSILICPANYLFAKKHKVIISGKKITLTTFINGGKDFLAEKIEFIGPENNLLFSYMR